jgi:hypothetical protein
MIVPEREGAKPRSREGVPTQLLFFVLRGFVGLRVEIE